MLIKPKRKAKKRTNPKEKQWPSEPLEDTIEKNEENRCRGKKDAKESSEAVELSVDVEKEKKGKEKKSEVHIRAKINIPEVIKKFLSKRVVQWLLSLSIGAASAIGIKDALTPLHKDKENTGQKHVTIVERKASPIIELGEGQSATLDDVSLVVKRIGYYMKKKSATIEIKGMGQSRELILPVNDKTSVYMPMNEKEGILIEVLPKEDDTAKDKNTIRIRVIILGVNESETTEK